MRHFFLIPLIAALAACGSAVVVQSPDNSQAHNFKRPEPGQTIIILPPQTANREFAPTTDPLRKKIYHALEDAGYQPLALDDANYAELWNNEVADVGGIYDAATGQFRPDAYALALSHLARWIGTHQDCALILSPTLVLKTADFVGNRASWDGVIKAQPESTVVGSHYGGTTRGLSVKLVAFNPQGEWQFTAYGGLMLPYETNYDKNKMTLRDNLLADPGETDDGVKAALMPLIR